MRAERITRQDAEPRIGIRVIAALEALAGPTARLQSHADRNWASATFAGSRHTVILRFEGSDGIDAGEQFIAALSDHEFAIPGQIVADAVIVDVAHYFLPVLRLDVSCELLLVEES